MDSDFSCKNSILSHSFKRDIKYLQAFGIYTALIPLRKVRDFGKQYQMHIPLLITSFAIAMAESIWDWDNMNLSSKTRNSDKIEYVVFHFALWTSSTLGRLAFIICALNCGKFFADATNYLKIFVAPFCHQLDLTEKPNIPFKKRRKYKLIFLLALHIIYASLVVEFLVKEFATPYGRGANLKSCNRRLVPCNYEILSSVLTVLFQFLRTSPQYFLTYFVIVVSDFLIQALESFQYMVLNGKPTRYRGKHLNNMNSSKKDMMRVFPASEMIFGTREGNVDIPSTIFSISKDKNKAPQLNADMSDNEEALERDLHEQFAHLRDLFLKFIRAVGVPLITSCFSDILILISLIFSIIPQLSRVGGPGPYMGGGWGNMNNFTNQSAPAFPCPPCGIPLTQNESYLSNDSVPYYEVSSQGFAGAMSHLPRNLPGAEKEMSTLTRDLLYFFHYSFQVLYECRAILLASIGSMMKYKINCLKDMIDLNLRPKPSRPSSRGQQFEVFKISSGNSDRFSLDSVLINKIEKWKWEFRPLDMVTIDLSLIPALLGTVMCYVVVLLQIRISEDQIGVPLN